MGPQGLSPDALTAGVADIEAARIALRWALERIRALEDAGHAAARRDREEGAELEGAKRAMQAAQRDLERRERLLSLREGFVADMRRLLDAGDAGQAARLRAASERERLEGELARARDSAMHEVEAAAAAAEDALGAEKRRLAEVEHGFQSVLEEPLRRQAEALGAEHRRELAELSREAADARDAFAAASAERDARLEDLGRRLDAAARREQELRAAHAVELEQAAQRARLKEEALRSDLERAGAEAAQSLASALDRLGAAEARLAEERAAAAERLRAAEAAGDAAAGALRAAEERFAAEMRASREALGRLEDRLSSEEAATAERLSAAEERRAAEVARLEVLCAGLEARLAEAEARSREADARLRESAELRARLEARAAEGEAAARAAASELSRLDAAATLAESRRAGAEAAARAEVQEARRRESDALGAAWKAQSESAERLGAAEARRAAEVGAAGAEARRLQDSVARLEARLAEAEGAARSALEEARRREAEAREALARAAAESAERQATGEARRAAEAAQAQAELRRLETACARLEERLARPQAQAPSAPLPVPDVPPRARIDGRKALLGVLLAAGAASAAFVAVRPLGREHVLPTSHPSALVWDGGSLWVADWHDGVVHVLSAPGLRPGRRIALGGTHPVGLAVGRDRVFIADAWTRRIERRRKDDALTLESSVPSPGPKPSGLFFDGKYLWSADQALGRVYQHADDEALTVLGEFPAAHAPVGLYYGPEGFWTVDAKDGGFFRLQPPPGMAVAESYRLRELADDARPFSAFTWGGGRLWVARDGSATLLERPAWLLSERR